MHEADNKNSSGTAEAVVCHQQQKNMEINNNENSPYLHERCEDKGDKLISSVQCESDKGICATKSDVIGRTAKSLCISKEAKVNVTIKSSQSDSDKSMSSAKSDNDECAKLLLNERTMEPDERVESAKCVINNEMAIKSDSERLDVKEISSNDQNTLIASREEDARDVKQSTDADGECANNK